MNCNEAVPLIAAHADGEVDRMGSHSIATHLAACAECRVKYDAVLALRARLHDEVPHYVAPPALRARIAAIATGTPGANHDAPRMPQRWRWLAAGALGGCVATLMAWMLGVALLQWKGGEDLAADAVAAHSRATLGHHLIEIASADQHTVKPWLSARLDYSPPVRDLGSEGFPLLGGRLDYLDGRPVAVLVYGYRQHTIDVFVRPGPSRASSSALRSLRGFNVARATGGGMDWLAVSDVNVDVLDRFVQQISEDPAAPVR